MANKIKLAVFDVAGTTVKDNGEIVIAFQAALRKYGYQVPAEEINPLMGYNKPEAISIICNRVEKDKAKITRAYIEAIHTRFVAMMIGFYTKSKKLQPLPHTEQTFAFLQERSIKVGLDTGFSDNITRVIIDRLGWLKNHLVDYMVSSNEVPAGRPHPYMIQKLMQMAGVSNAQHVIKIGDTEVDVNEGKNAGCLHSIAVTTGAFIRKQLEPSHPSFILDNLSELMPIIDNNS